MANDPSKPILEVEVKLNQPSVQTAKAQIRDLAAGTGVSGGGYGLANPPPPRPPLPAWGWDKPSPTGAQQAALMATFQRRMQMLGETEATMRKNFSNQMRLQRQQQATQQRAGMMFLPGETRAATGQRLFGSLGAAQMAQAEAAAKKLGITTAEFIKIKSGATAAEARNANMLQRQLTPAMNQTTAATVRSTSAFGQMGRVLRSLATAFIGFQLLRGLQRGFQNLIQFQSMLQQVRLGVAEVLLISNQFRDKLTGAVLPIGQQVKLSFQIAARSTEELVKRAIDIGVPLDNLVKTYTIAAGLSAQANISQKDTLDIVTQISVLAQRLNIPYTQVSRSIDNILLGQKTQITQLGRVLQLNDAVAQEQIQQGTYGKYLLDRLQGITAVLPENLKTFEGIKQSIRSIVLDLSRRVYGGAFDVLQTSLGDIRNRINELRKPENADVLAGYARSARQFAENVRDGILWMTQFVRQHEQLLKVLLAIYAARKLGPLGVFGVGALATGGIAAPLAGALAFGGARAALTSATAAATETTAAGALSGTALAGAGFWAALGRFSLALLAATVAVKGFEIATRNRSVREFGAHLGRRVEQYYTGPESYPVRALNYFLGTDLPQAGTETARSQQERELERAIAVEGQLAKRLTPRRLELLGQQVRGEQGPRAQRRGEQILQHYMGLLGGGGALDKGVLAGTTLGRTQAASYLVKQQEEYTNRLVEITSKDPIAQYLVALDKQLVASQKAFTIKQKEVAVALATGAAAEAQLGAQQRVLQVQLQLLEESSRGAQIAMERANAEERLGLARGAGSRRATAETRISALQSRIGLLGEQEQLAGSYGNVGAQQQLQKERFAAEREILQQRQVILESERETIQQTNREIDRRIGSQQEEIQKTLPARLNLELQILDAQQKQANIRAGAAQQEIGIIRPFLDELKTIQADIEARRAANPTDDRLGSRADTIRGQINQAQLDLIRARSAIAQAGGEANAVELQKTVARQKNIHDIAAAGTEITKSQTEQVGLGNDLVKNAEEQRNLNDEIQQLYVKQAQTLGQIAQAQSPVVSNMKQVLADLIAANGSLEDIFKNFNNRANQQGAERLAGVLVDTLGRLGTGQQVNLGGAFAAAFNPNLTAEQAQNRIATGGGNIDVRSVVEQARGVYDIFGGGGAASGGGGFGGLLGGIFGGGGGGAAAGTAQAGGGVGFSLGSAGTSAGVGFGGGGAGAGAGGYLAILQAAIIVGSAINSAADTFRKTKYSPFLTRSQVFNKADDALVGGLVKGVLSAYGLGALAKPLSKLFGAEARGGTGFDSLRSGRGVLLGILNPLNLISEEIAKLVKLFQAPTVGPLIARYIKPLLTEIGLPQNVRFGAGRGAVATNLIVGGPQGPKYPLPASYTPEVLARVLNLVAPAGSVLSRGVPRADLINALPTSLRASLIGAGAGLSLAPEDLIDLARQLTQKTAKDFQSGAFQVLGRVRREVAPISRGEAAQQIVSLYDAFNDLAPTIDRAALSLAVFGDDGTASLERLQRAAQDAQKVVTEGVPNALQAAIKSGQPYDAATSLAETFANTFTSRLSERLVQSGAIGSALTKASVLAGQAAEALAAGDLATFNRLASQARTAYATGSQAALTTINQILGPTLGFEASLGVYPGGTGVINPTGAGLPGVGHATPTARRVSGPVGMPRVSVLHGDEVIREGQQNDDMVRAINNLAAAQREVGMLLVRQGSDPSEVRVLLDVGDVVREIRSAEKRNVKGQGIQTPQAQIGVG